jgi:glycosyltransferase involved in cell wall biosynthesis
MISVIVPVFNEEGSISKVLADIEKDLEGFHEYEIIVVNDGSTDRTKDRIGEVRSKKISVIEHLENRGYGRSLFDGIKAAKYNCIAIIDSDGSYPADMIRKLYEYYPLYDMVVGARQGREYKRGIFKKPARMLFNYLVQYATGRKIPDVNSGLRIFKKDIVMNFQDSLCTGFSFTTTLTLIFFLNHFYIKYIPVDYFKRKGKSKVDHFKDTLRTAQIIVETISYYNPTKLFLLLASVNSGFGIVVGLLNYFFLKAFFLTVLSAFCVASFIPIFCLGFISHQVKKLYRINNG